MAQSRLDELRRDKFVRSIYSSAVGFCAPLSLSFVWYFFYNSSSILLLNLIATAVVNLGTMLLTAIWISRRAEGLTRKQVDLVAGVLQFMWILTVAHAVFYMEEARVAGLLYALVGLVFVLADATFRRAMGITVATASAYVISTMVAVHVFGQGGNLASDMFYALCFFTMAPFFGLVADRNRKQRRELASKNIELTAKNKKLTEQHDELKEIQLNLVQAEKLSTMGLLIAGVVHEIHNPVNIATLSMQDVKQQISRLKIDALNSHAANKLDESSAMGWVDLENNMVIASVALNRVADLVDALRRYSRKRDHRIERELVRLYDSLKTTVMIVGPSLHPNIHLTLEKPESDPLVLCQPDAINQVVINLLVNAGHALRELIIADATYLGEINVKMVKEEHSLSIKVADNGPGVSESDAENIFEPFFTTKPDELGIGLGLSISRKIIVDHLGTIKYEKNPKGGAVFSVYLPLYMGGESTFSDKHE